MFATIIERWGTLQLKISGLSVVIYFEGEAHSFFIRRKSKYALLNWSRSIKEKLKMKRLEKGVRPWIRQIKKREEKSRLKLWFDEMGL